ncbi:MAG TPA: pyridoxamine 5'-phosphate oxidase family protein [Vitreimonas sp.]|uniref:pyridoxamine 5'-phosphate oxidase family protein n=1 Tax=Vitreimonas sp. TaxID=3069702 RepID=UPI002D3A2D3A|nr:pyridoxamine 5'-phosphate oxidase family protein [Vitreimonas sp.]HYD89797.1 pyridoxamine 5'-phosphate oxidase family protein [Vitreimonas sp.]
MPSEREIVHKFWKQLQSDRTVLLGVEGSGEAQPMTALLESDDERGPVWFFSSKDVDLVNEIGMGQPGVLYFTAKGHDLFAGVHGELSLVYDRGVIERLWNPFVAAWYEGGKDDPSLQLIRFDPAHAHIWLNENSVFSGVKALLGRDPKQDYGGKTADVPLS